MGWWATGEALAGFNNLVAAEQQHCGPPFVADALPLGFEEQPGE